MPVTNFAQMMEKPVAENVAGINRGSVDDGWENFDDKQENDQVDKGGLSKKKELGITGGDKIDQRTVDQGIDLV